MINAIVRCICPAVRRSAILRGLEPVSGEAGSSERESLDTAIPVAIVFLNKTEPEPS